MKLAARHNALLPRICSSGVREMLRCAASISANSSTPATMAARRCPGVMSFQDFFFLKPPMVASIRSGVFSG
jgi:hypothetical protein